VHSSSAELPRFRRIALPYPVEGWLSFFLAEDRLVCLVVVQYCLPMAPPDAAPAQREASARERIVGTAYQLFTRRGIRAVSVDEVIEHAAVAKATLYRHFSTKDDLVLAVLQRRDQRWTDDLVQAQSRARGDTAEAQLLAIFDVLHDWFCDRDEFDGCSFVKVLLEMGADHPAGQACLTYLDNIRAIVRQRAQAAGLRDAEDFARSWHILMTGCIVSATEGDTEAAHRAAQMARDLIERHRGPTSDGASRARPMKRRARNR
jgi:AcrR family transcriptional regulator